MNRLTSITFIGIILIHTIVTSLTVFNKEPEGDLEYKAIISVRASGEKINFTLPEGMNAIFPCITNNTDDKVAFGHEENATTLTLGETVFSNDSRITVRHRPIRGGVNGSIWKLLLDDTVVSDSGTYSCLVNDQYTQKQSVYLHVFPLNESMSYVPDITVKNIHALEAVIGQNYTLKCDVTSPVYITSAYWMVGEKEVTSGYSGEKYQMNRTGTTYKIQTQLTVRNVTKSDFREYVCIVDNLAGSTNARMVLRERDIFGQYETNETAGLQMEQLKRLVLLKINKVISRREEL